MILLIAGESSKETLNMYYYLVKNCSRFKPKVEKRRAKILPRIRLMFA